MDGSKEITQQVDTGRLLDAVLVSGTVKAAAKALDLSYTKALKLYKQALQAYWEENADKAEIVAAKELRKFDLIERPVFKQALEGDLRAVDRMLAISKARREVLGLDAPKRFDVQVGAVDSAISDIAQMIDGSAVAAEPLRIVRAETA